MLQTALITDTIIFVILKK